MKSKILIDEQHQMVITMKPAKYSSILNVLAFCTLIWCMIIVFPGRDSSTTTVLSVSSPSLQLTIEARKDLAQLIKLGWDTEGTGRDTINLLKSPVELLLSKEDQELKAEVTSRLVDRQTIQYKFRLPDNNQLTWEIAAGDGELFMQIFSNDDLTAFIDKIELLFPFNPKKTITSIISSNCTKDGRFILPVIVSAPDIGQMLLTSIESQGITGYTEGNRPEGWVQVKIELPVPDKKSATNLKFTPVVLPVPHGFTDIKRWEAARRGWFNRFDLGIPVCLRPVPHQEMEHYTEFQQFLNGGCCVSNTAYMLDALYIVGMTQQADMILDAMLKRQKEGVFPNGGGFQNGFVDKMGFGAEVYDWKGGTTGYEGHLVYCWNFLHSMLRKEPALSY